MKPFTEDVALQWAMRECARREYCRHDLAGKMRAKGLDEQGIARILDRLTSEQFLDEARYAQAFVHDKMAYNGWGSLKVREALRMKRLADADIRHALADIDDDSYRRSLRRLLKSKAASIDFDPTNAQEAYKATMKLLRFAASRGFEYEVASRAIAELQQEDS